MNFKTTLSLIAIMYILSACGGGGSVVVPISNSNPNSSLKSQTITPTISQPKITSNQANLNNNIVKANRKEQYENIASITVPASVDIVSKLKANIDLNTKSETIQLFSKLYNRAYASFKAANNESAYTSTRASASNKSVGFSANWNQGFLGNGIVIGINDNGTNDLTNVLINEHYEYKNGIKNTWNTPISRLDDNNFLSIAYTQSYLSNTNPLLHGKNVMSVANAIASKIKFANIVNPIGAEEGEQIDIVATVDALSNSGVRFFNQSFAYNKPKASSPNPGIFYIAIMKNNALVFNAVGNELSLDETFTSHALPLDSPLRKGWVIVTGYRADALGNKLDANSHYYITGNDGNKYEVFHYGNTCKTNGWDNCISAPYTINNQSGTSFSTPVTASVAALVYEKYPWMSNDNIKETLFSTAFKVTSTTNSDDDIKARFGIGILNPSKAMNGVMEFRHDFNANVDLDNLYEFSNDIKGRAGIIKDGIGTLLLSGNNTFTGNSEIKDGVLWLSGKNSANFINNSGILRLSNASAANITNNSIMINESATIKNLELGKNSKIYSNLGDILNVTNDALLSGEYNLVGVKSGANISKGDNVDIINAGNIVGKFDTIQSLAAFLDISKPIYTDTKVSVNVTKLDIDKINELNEYSSKNYKSLFAQLDNYLAYEHGKKGKITLDDELAYNERYLNGGLNEDEYRLADAFYASVLNTPKSNLAISSNKLFGYDLYNNNLMNISKIKNIHRSELKNNFNIEQSYTHGNVNTLTQSANKTIISNSFLKDNLKLAFGFVYDKANIYNNNFENNARTIGLKTNLTYSFDSLSISNNLSYLNTLNKTQRFENFAKFYTNSLAYTLKLSYKLYNDYLVSNLFEPYIAINGIYSRQNSFNERGNEFSVGLDSFNKFYSYANLGFNLNTYFDNLSLSVGTDIEYNFYKGYSLKGKNLNYLNKIEISDGFYKNFVSNANVGIEYLFNNQLKMSMNYKLSYMYNNSSTNKEKYFDFSTDYSKAKKLKNYTNEFMFGINYIF